MCALLALRAISPGVKVDRSIYSDDEEHPDGPALIELDGWKDPTVDTDLETMVGQLEGITIDGSGLVIEIKAGPDWALSGEFKNS